MTDVFQLITMLQNKDHNKRYEACEELRTSQSPLPQEALDALAIAKNDKNPDVADAARRALEFHNTSESIIEKASNTPVDSADDSQKEGTEGKPRKNTGGLIAYYVLIFLVSIFSCPTVILGAAVQSNNILYGAVFIFVLLLIAPLFFTNESRKNNESQSSMNGTPSAKTDDGNALEKFIEKIDFSKLTEKPEYYYKAGIVFLEKGQYDDGIIQFTKVIKITSVEDDLYASAQKELESMGFSKMDIESMRQAKNVH